jgi:hypothetical protein
MAQQWATDLEAKYGMPLDQIPGKVYVLHYEVPQLVKSVSRDYAGPSPQADADGFLSANLAAAECRIERRRADVPHVVGDVDRESGGNDLVDAIKHVGGQLDPIGGKVAV